MKDSRKIFFAGLLTALLVFSNIVVVKMMVIFNLPLPCSVITYPFTFLCVTVINELYGAKSAMKSICFAIIIQILLLVLGTIIVNLPNQITTINEANALQMIIAPKTYNGIYIPNVKILLSSLLAFTVAQFINIGLFTFARKSTYKFIACSLSILFGIIVDILIFIPLSSNGLTGKEIILKITNQFVAGITGAIISIILFLIFTIKSTRKKEEQIN